MGGLLLWESPGGLWGECGGAGGEWCACVR